MKIAPFLILTMLSGGQVYGDVVTVNPANYAPAGTLLTTIVPQVTLYDADSTNATDTFFTITSFQESSNGNLSGLWDFADGGIAFYNNNTRLRIDFNVPVTDVQIEFVSDAGPSNTATGTLNVFDSAGDNLGQFTTAALSTAQAETMDVPNLPANTAYAVATGSNGGFGRLTDLQVTTTVPEPGTMFLCLVGLPVCLSRRR